MASKTGAVAYSYARFSHPSQAEGDSIRRQTALRDDWLKRNKVPLDTSLVFEDKGKSAFKEGIDLAALNEFLWHVEQGRVARGSYLILECLDRLSRGKPSKAVGLLMDILRKDIRIVQLLPRERVFDGDNLDMLGLFEAVFQLTQGHEESLKKSERLGEAWAEKRKQVVGGKGVMTVTAPGWLTFKTAVKKSGGEGPEESRATRKERLEKGKFVLNAHAKTVKRIYQWCIEGFGAYAIVAKLNAEKVPTWGRSPKWSQGVVLYALHSRAAMGEYQPYTEYGTKGRTAVGDPVKGYYPAVVDEGTWELANAKLRERKTTPGRKPNMGVNLFRGLMFDARDGERMGIMSNGRLPVYTTSAYRTGPRNGSFPVGAFEAAILSQLAEVDPASILPPQGKKADRVMSITNELEKVKARLAARRADLVESDVEDDPLVDVVRELAAKVKTLTDELNAAKREASSPLTEAWSEVKTLVSLAGSGDDMRTRLRAAITRVVEEMWVLVIFGNGLMRWAVVEVYFKGGGVRHYLISYRRGIGGAAGKQAPVWKVDPSFRTAALKLESLKDYRHTAGVIPADYGREVLEAKDAAPAKK